jgi:hypothetical protein
MWIKNLDFMVFLLANAPGQHPTVEALGRTLRSICESINGPAMICEGFWNDRRKCLLRLDFLICRGLNQADLGKGISWF